MPVDHTMTGFAPEFRAGFDPTSGKITVNGEECTIYVRAEDGQAVVFVHGSLRGHDGILIEPAKEGL